MSHPTIVNGPVLYDVVRYARNAEVVKENGKLSYQPLVGEEAALLTVFCGFAMARRGVTIESFSGTGKTVIADAVWNLIPDDMKMVVDMLSPKALWYKANEINAKTFLYFPEEQNASDNDEVVKVKKKLGDGKDAEREVTGGVLGEGLGRTTEKYVIKWHPDLSTVAIENRAGANVFDDESRRRRIVVTTDPSGKQTRAVVKKHGGVWARGVEAEKTMSSLEALTLRAHVARCIAEYDRVPEVRFFGAEAFAEQVPAIFTSTRSAFKLLQQVARGVAVFYADREQIATDAKTGETFIALSPARFAETLDFYGDGFFSNCMKLPPMGSRVIGALPQPKLDQRSGVVSHDAMRTEAELLRDLAGRGVVMERSKVRTILKKCVDAGFVEENDELNAKRYHRTPAADFEAWLKWGPIVEACRSEAKTQLGDQAEAWVARYCGLNQPIQYVSPIDGAVRTVA